MHRRIQELKLGAKVERRRREPSRGAEGAKGVPLPTGEGSGDGAVPLPRNFFWDFGVRMAYFSALLVLNFVFFRD